MVIQYTYILEFDVHVPASGGGGTAVQHNYSVRLSLYALVFSFQLATRASNKEVLLAMTKVLPTGRQYHDITVWYLREILPEKINIMLILNLNNLFT